MFDITFISPCCAKYLSSMETNEMHRKFCANPSNPKMGILHLH